MSGTTLEFPHKVSSKKTVVYTLTRVGDTSGQERLVLCDVDLKRDGNSLIYRATLHMDGEKTVDVVCKVVYTKRKMKKLRHEAALYGKELKKLQGKIVPVFYGLFEGEMEDEEMAGCLITQYCGERSRVPFFGMTWDQKKTLILTMMKLHRAGVRHGDFCERNVVINPEGNPVIIDFDAAEPHNCERTMVIALHRAEPDPEEFKCQELYNACLRIGVWSPRFLDYFYYSVPTECADTPEMLADFAPPEIGRAEALRQARVAIHRYDTILKRRMACDWRPVDW